MNHLARVQNKDASQNTGIADCGLPRFSIVMRLIRPAAFF